CLLLLVCLVISSILADYPLYIDKLDKGKASKQDKKHLDRLDDDEYTPRSQLKSQFDDILARQSPAVQAKYQEKVLREERKRTEKEEKKMRKYQEKGRDAVYRQILSIEGDLSLSEKQVKQQTKMLKKQL
ncbi:hypothetical protein PENTCL1PPCAC_5273, partial [Pristionchus entomophagus]